MLKKERVTFAAALCCFALVVNGVAAQDEAAGMFPEFNGWTKDGTPEVYDADNLWEYINGAADMYLLYDFKQVATQTYENGSKQSFTIDVYEHSSPRNAYGIYSREKPRASDFLSIGTQAYYEKGIINLFKGNYYVKIIGFYLEDKEERLLKSVAQEVAGRLEGEARFPGVLACFPTRGKINNSDIYIARDFLGRSILRSAYVVEYEMEGEKKRVFIMEAEDEGQASEMLARYIDEVEEKGNTVTGEKGVFRFQDPYFRFEGLMNIKARGKYVWGLFSADRTISAFYLNEIEKNLKTNKLID